MTPKSDSSIDQINGFICCLTPSTDSVQSGFLILERQSRQYKSVNEMDSASVIYGTPLNLRKSKHYDFLQKELRKMHQANKEKLDPVIASSTTQTLVETVYHQSLINVLHVSSRALCRNFLNRA